VLLNLGARPNQHPQHTRSGNTHDTAAGSPNRLGWFLKPVRPLLLDLAPLRQRKPVRPVWQTGQTDIVQKLPKDPKHLNSHSTSEQTKPKRNRVLLAQKLLSTAHRAKPVRPVWETGQAGLGNRSGRFLPEQSGRTQPARKTQPFHQSISRFVPRIKVRLWG
jgi:hypothetical protein